MGPKKDQKEEETTQTTLSAVVIADNFNDSIFLHEAASEIPLACRPLCNVPIINYTLLWLLKTGVKRVLLVSTESRTEGLKLVEKNWSLQFEQFQWIRCAGSKSVGDSIKELLTLELLKGDFLLISNPATITNSTLEKNIAKYYKMRKKDKSNALSLIYVEFGKENPKLALMRETNQLIAYHSPNNIHQLEGHVKESTTVSIRTDLMFSGIAICSESIANAFKDNFDFETLNDVIREFFDKEEILNLNIHIDVLPEDESAYSATDYATLMNLSQMVMDRWFYPIVPEKASLDQFITYHPGNVYLEECDENCGRSMPTQKYSPKSYQMGVAYGKRCRVGDHLDLVCAIFGSDCVIEDGCSLHRCIVGSNCKIGKNCILEEICIGNGVQIPDGTKITSRHAVIDHGVSYPSGLECPRNCMISTAQPPEDDMDDFKVREEQGVFIWNMRSGDDLWNGTKRRRRTTSGIESDAQSLNQNVPAGHESADEDPDQIPSAVFFEEVVELMQRVLELEGPEGEDTRMRNAKERMENLKLEINSLRFANNVPWEDVLKLSVLAMLSFQQAHTLNDLKKFFCRWSHFFASMYKGSDQQRQILAAFETKLKDSSAESPWLSPKAITVLIHYLYDELDLLEDDAILIWFDELEHAELKKEMQKIVDWLEEDSSEEEESGEEVGADDLDSD